MILHEAKNDHENSEEFLPMLALTPLSLGESFSTVNDTTPMPFFAFGDSDDDEDDMEEDDFDDMEEDDFDDDDDEDEDDDFDDDEDEDDDFDDDDDYDEDDDFEYDEE